MKTKCCERNAITNMDHLKAGPDNWNTPDRMVNRMCLHCGKHWYGKEGQVKEYTRKEWDSWINSAFAA